MSRRSGPQGRLRPSSPIKDVRPHWNAWRVSHLLDHEVIHCGRDALQRALRCRRKALRSIGLSHFPFTEPAFTSAENAYSPSPLSPGWPSGRRPSGQRNLRSCVAKCPSRMAHPPCGRFSSAESWLTLGAEPKKMPARARLTSEEIAMQVKIRPLHPVIGGEV